jgi:hypothetical protein
MSGTQELPQIDGAGTHSSSDTEPPVPTSLADFLSLDHIGNLTAEKAEELGIAPVLVAAESTTSYLEEGFYLCILDKEQDEPVLRLIKEGEIDMSSSITPYDPDGFPFVQIILKEEHFFQLSSRANILNLFEQRGRHSKRSKQFFSDPQRPLSLIFFGENEKLLNHLAKGETTHNRSIVRKPVETA